MTDETASAEGEPDAFYTDVPSKLNHEVAIGGALITMVEPHLGHEKGYNRWYEDDHFYAGAMCMPWMMAGRRYVATRDLQLLRYPEDSWIAQPVTAGRLGGPTPECGSRAVVPAPSPPEPVAG